MGLDSVELVLATEEEFGIHIDDADAEKITTPGMLADYVASRLGSTAAGQGHCRTQAGFYRLRAGLVKHFGARRKEVRPDSDIRTFLTGDTRKQWEKLKTAIDAPRLPELECRKSISYPLCFGMPLAGALLLLLATVPAWTLLPAALVLFIAAAIIAGKLADTVPEKLRTLGALVPYVLIPRQEEWTRDDILQRVMLITSEQLGIPLEGIHPDHHFVKDLGMD